jgi:two-component system, cell cycle sensor histidine kinase and response regulator CckA
MSFSMPPLKTLQMATTDGLARLQRMTAALSGALTREQVADVIIEHGLAALGAASAVISLLSEDTAEFVNLRIVGYPQEMIDAWPRIPASLPMAIPDSVRLRSPVILASWKARVERYPAFQHANHPGADGAPVAIPMLLQDRALGALGLTFDEEREFSPSEVDFMLAVAGQCAQALERARLYDVEHAAREQAEREAAERGRANAALEQSEARFRLLFTSHPHPMWVYDLQTLRFLEVNNAAVDRYGYTHDQFLQMRITDIRPEEDNSRLFTDLQAPRPQLQRSGMWRHRDRDGRLFYVEITSHTLEFMGREAALVVAQDVTERMRLEEERAYIMSSALCLLWSAEISAGNSGEIQDEPYLQWQMTFPDMEAAQRFMPLDLRAGETYADAWYRCRVPEDRQRCDQLSALAIRQGQSYQQDFRMRCAGDSLRWLHEKISVETVVAGQEWRAVGVATDVSERKRLEDQLLQAQKLESVGRLAGGVAHDFNNLLAVIAGHTELAEEEVASDAPVMEHIRVIGETTERAANLTRQLLAFARKQVIEPRIINFNALALSMEKMLRRLIGENIRLATRLQPDLGAVNVDPGQFEQILVNLAVNARDAMPEGGILTIETANVSLDENYTVHYPGVTAGDYVMLAVSDTGVGIEEAVKGQIFEPFFTTKDKGKGTGLGLATVYGIVKQSGGNIWVYSELQHGTAFKIYIPRVGATAIPSAEPVREEGRPRGTETVMVVEDEPSLRALTVSALQKQGYAVLEAENGEHALRVAADYPAAIHLLVTDVIMPQMGGKSLAGHLRRMRPGLKVLYTSGYTDDMIAHHGVLEAEVAFLQKPFTLVALAHKVRAVLDAAEHAAEGLNEKG